MVNMTDSKTKVETTTSTTSNAAQESSELFDTARQNVLKVADEISKFQPQYTQSISNLQQEYIQLIKEFVNKVFATQRNWAGSGINTPNTSYTTKTYAPYTEQIERQTNEITAQALSVFDTSNQLAINAINAARENLKLYGKAIDAVTEFNNNVANAWASFFASAQRQQYFRQ